jgi:hypothetical protein
MKILVFMSDNRRLAPVGYHSLAAAINYTYCKKYGYDFLYYRPYYRSLLNDSTMVSWDPVKKRLRHAAWAKLLACSAALDMGYDYVVYIDSDCIFKDFERRVESVIRGKEQFSLIFLNNKPHKPRDVPCSGFFIAKVCDDTRAIMDSWHAFDFHGRQNPLRYEQGALYYMYEELNVCILDEWMFTESEGQWLRHIVSKHAEKRVAYFTNFVQAAKIDLAASIAAINVKEFDTAPVPV